MNLSVNTLTDGYKNYLESAPSLLEKNFNKSQYRKGIVNHIDESIRDLYHILPKAHLLNKEQMYDKINALSLYKIFETMLKDVEQKTDYKTEKYDFRTIELARMLFHISTIYLIKSPLYHHEEIVETDVKRIAYHFRKLAEHALEKESYGTIKEKEQRRLIEELNKIKYDPESKYQKLNRQYGKLAKEKKNTTDKELRKKLAQQIDEITIKRNQAQKEVEEKEREINKQLSHKHDHLMNVFCPFEKLTPFNGRINPHFPNDHIENQNIGI